jgi:hypothetical protein
MSSHAGKPRDVKYATTIDPSASDEIDWTRLDAIDDEDILFDEDSPELTAEWFEGAKLNIKARAPTSEELEILRAKLSAYINRPVKGAK